MGEFPPHPRQTVLDCVWGTARDEDGRRVRPLRAETRRKHVRGWDRRRAFRGARWRATPVWAKWALGLALGWLLASAACLVGLSLVSWIFGVRFGGEVGAVLGYSLLGSIGAVIVVGLVMMYVDDRAATRAMLSMRVCAACFYDLRGIPGRGSGVVVCPECGCAWRVEARSGAETER